MREIEFRAWKKSAQTMIKVGELTFFTDGTYNVNGEDPDCILMQYTGFKDKNNLKIYELDIYKTFGVDGEEIIGVVKWSSIGWNGQGFGFKDNLEVIGNLYRTPELVE